MITLALGCEIGAPRERVWAALSDAAQVTRWRPGVVAARDAAEPYPVAGVAFGWRARVRDLPLHFDELPLEVHAPVRLRSALRFGLFHCDETLSLTPCGSCAGHTRVSLRISTPNEMAVVGGSLDRFAVRRFAMELASATLFSLRDWCEHGVAGTAPLPQLPGPALAAAGG